METYRGCIETTDDALLIFEACRLGMLQRVSRRLVEEERNCIQSGSVYVWDESESGIRRWTDGKRWSPSRVNGCFLIYTELEPKTAAASSPSKPGLVKKALSLFTAHASKLHLVCYYNKEDLNNGKLITPSQDPLLCKLPIPRSLYPDVIPELIHVASSHSISGYPMRADSYSRSSALSLYPVAQSSSLSSAQRCSGQSRSSALSSVAVGSDYLRNQYPLVHRQAPPQYLASQCASPQARPIRHQCHSGPVMHDTHQSPLFQPHYMVSVPAGSPQPTANKVNNHQTLAISKYDPISMPQGPRSAPLLRTETKQEQNSAIQQLQHQQQHHPAHPISELQYSATSRSGVINHRSMSQPVPPRSSISQSTEVLPLAMVPCQRSSTTTSMAGTSSSPSSSSVRLPPISDLFNAVEQISKRRPANAPSSVELSGARGRYMGEPWGRTSGLRSTIRGPGGYLSGNNDMAEHK